MFTIALIEMDFRRSRANEWNLCIHSCLIAQFFVFCFGGRVLRIRDCPRTLGHCASLLPSTGMTSGCHSIFFTIELLKTQLPFRAPSASPLSKEHKDI